MKLRVTVGPQAEEVRIPTGQGMKVIHRSPQLIVEGSDDIRSGTTLNGSCIIIAGDIFGIRSGSGEMRRLDSTLSEVAALVSCETPQRSREKLEGRYVLISIPQSNRACDIWCDRFGKLDLYYQKCGTATIIATEMSLLPFSTASSVKYDQPALVHTLCVYGFRPPKKHTIYEEVRRVGVDEWMHVRDGKVSLMESPFRPLPVSEYGERELHEYADILLDAVRLAGSDDGNIVYLSSGWDSTALLACLVKIFGRRKVRTVIARMLYASRSGVINQFEIDRAQAVADYFGVHHQVIDLDFRNKIPEMFEHLRPHLLSHQINGLTALSHGVLADYVARTTTGNEAVFAGEISDGVHNLGFSQFATIFHPVLEFREYSDKMASYLFGPTFLRLFQSNEYSKDLIYNLFRSRSGDAVFDAPTDGNHSRRTMQLLASFFLRGNRLPLWSLRNCKVLTATGAEVFSTAMEGTYLSQAAREITPEALYSWYLHLYNSFHWQASTVRTMSLTADVYGLRLALPFWDSRLHEFLSAMPESWGRGLDLKPTKYPLKWALQNRIDYPLHLQTGPHSYLYDVNPNFNHAAEVLYASAFVPHFRECLKKRAYLALLSPEVFDVSYIDRVVDRYLDGVEVRGAEMNDLTSLIFLSIVGWYGV